MMILHDIKNAVVALAPEYGSVTHVTLKEGGEWIPVERVEYYQWCHAALTEDGQIYDSRLLAFRPPTVADAVLPPSTIESQPKPQPDSDLTAVRESVDALAEKAREIAETMEPRPLAQERVGMRRSRIVVILELRHEAGLSIPKLRERLIRAVSDTAMPDQRGHSVGVSFDSIPEN